MTFSQLLVVTSPVLMDHELDLYPHGKFSTHASLTAPQHVLFAILWIIFALGGFRVIIWEFAIGLMSVKITSAAIYVIAKTVASECLHV